MSDLNMSDVFELPFKPADYQNGIVNGHGCKVIFVDMLNIEKEALCNAINSHDQLTADLAEAKAEKKEMWDALQSANSNCLKLGQELHGAQKEIERLRGLVKSAYEDGYHDGYNRGIDDGHPLGGHTKDVEGDWSCSDTIELLEKNND